MATRRSSRLLAGLLTTALLGAGTAVWPHARGDESSAAASTTVSVASLTPVAAEVEVEPDTSALEAVTSDARWSVAVTDVESGETLVFGDDSDTYDTASIVKVDILAALLDRQDGELTAAQREQAAAMIGWSDNASATSLLAQAGGADAVDDFNDSIGLSDTDVSATWGLTRTTAADQVALLGAVLGEDSVLGADGSATLLDLMSDVVGAQRFGASAAADDPTDAAVKVGYLPRSTTGEWDVTSIGRVEHEGRTYDVAVLSEGSATFAEGVALVDEIAATAVDAL